MESQCFNFPQATKLYLCTFIVRWLNLHIFKMPNCCVNAAQQQQQQNIYIYNKIFLIRMNTAVLCNQGHIIQFLWMTESLRFISVFNRPTIKPSKSVSLCNNQRKSFTSIVCLVFVKVFNLGPPIWRCFNYNVTVWLSVIHRCQWQRPVLHLLHIRGICDWRGGNWDSSSPGVSQWSWPGAKWEGMKLCFSIELASHPLYLNL